MTAALPAGSPARRGGDAGVATVWAATAVAVLIGVLVAMLDLASAVAARHRAETAADLAALAAAGQAAYGTTTACVRADTAATGSGARIVQCRLQGWEALVEVEVGVRLSLLGTVTVRSRARAGPADEKPSTPRPTVRQTEPTRRHGERSTSKDERTETQVMHGHLTTEPNNHRKHPHRARSPSEEHRSATVAGMVALFRAYLDQLDGSGRARICDHDVAPQSAVGSARH